MLQLIYKNIEFIKEKMVSTYLNLKFALGAIPIVSIPTGIVKYFVHQNDESKNCKIVNDLNLETVANITDKTAQKIFKYNLNGEISKLKWYGLLQMIPLVGIYFAWAEKELLEKINALAKSLNVTSEQVNQSEVKKPSEITKEKITGEKDYNVSDHVKPSESSNNHVNVNSGSINAVISSKLDNVNESFAAFIVELEKEIFPFYEEHEKGFDKSRIHGRMHIGRAVIFCEVMARYYKDQGESVDFDYVRRTTGLHDAGRKGNGLDRWEKESCDLLYEHLIRKNIPKEEASQKSTIILKEKADKNSIEFKIFQSADCLDIMRPCTDNGGRAGFKPHYLTFLANAEPKAQQFRTNLIEEAWIFIEITEKQKMTEFNKSEGFMEKLFQIIREHQDKLPILSSIL